MWAFLSVIASVMIVSAASAQSLIVAVPQQGNWDTGITDMGIQQGFFKAAGLDVTTVYTQGGSQTMQAILSGSADLAVGSGTLGVLGAYAKGAPVRVLSAEMTGASDMFWYVKADSPLKTLTDAGGKTISFSEAGSSTNLVLLALLQQVAVNAKPVAVGGVPNALTQTMSGQIDIGWSAVPFNLQAVQDGTLRILARGQDATAFRDQTTRVNFTTTTILAAKADAIARYNLAYVKSLEWAYSDPNALVLFEAATKISPAIAKQTITEFQPKSAMQPYKVDGLDLLLKEALDFKYIPKPATPADVAPLFSTMIKAPG